MKIVLLASLILFTTVTPVFAQNEIKLTGIKTNLLYTSDNAPVVYRPTRVIIGKENIFQIKAAPRSYVSLAVSMSNSGAPKFVGKDLRLGADLITKEGKIPDNGILELSYTLPNDKTLVNKTLYFEVAVWKNQDFSDLRLAKIIAADGQETNENNTIIAMPPKDVSRPSLSPMMPGMNMDIMKTVDAIEKIKSGKANELESQTESDVYYKTPAVIRNLNAPEINHSK